MASTIVRHRHIAAVCDSDR